MPKKPTKAQERARSKLSKASAKARVEYHELPLNMQTASQWHALVKKYLK